MKDGYSILTVALIVWVAYHLNEGNAQRLVTHMWRRLVGTLRKADRS